MQLMQILVKLSGKTVSKIVKEMVSIQFCLLMATLLPIALSLRLYADWMATRVH